MDYKRIYLNVTHVLLTVIAVGLFSVGLRYVQGPQSVATPISPTSTLIDNHPDYSVWLHMSKGF